MQTRNLATTFFSRVAETSGYPAVQFKTGKSPYQTLTWEEFGRLVREAACGLAELGLAPGAKVAIFSQTAHLWVAGDLASICNGAASVPIYPTSSHSDIVFILNNSEARFVFVQNDKLAKKILAMKDELPQVERLILMYPSSEKTMAALISEFKLPPGYLLSFDQLQNIGAQVFHKNNAIVESRAQAIEPEELATIIYTSGTTGTPKGVPLTHHNILSVLNDLKVVLPLRHDDVYLSYLPMSHVFERVCGEFYWIHSGGCCAFAEGIETMAKNMAEVKPSMILVVPRVLDRIYTKVRNGIEGASGRARKLIEWSLAIGREIARHQAEGKTPRPGLLMKHWLAEKLVLRKLRERIGPNLRLVVSGGAPATPKVIEFFASLGITTLEGYGLTETAAPACVNLMEKNKIGTVGPTLPSVQAKISADGEILLKGPSIFKGYFHNPEANQEAFEDGWFKTGDIGTMDGDGYIAITDRKKDIIVNSAGKNVAPQRVEAVIKTIPLINQAVVFGDKRKCLVALLTLDEQVTVEFAREQGWHFESFVDLSRSQDLNQYLKKEISARTVSLADYEQVKRFSILTDELSVEAGELTATLKIKCNVVARNYKDLIDSMYEENAPVVPPSQTYASSRN